MRERLLRRMVEAGEAAPTSTSGDTSERSAPTEASGQRRVSPEETRS